MLFGAMIGGSTPVRHWSFTAAHRQCFAGEPTVAQCSCVQPHGNTRSCRATGLPYSPSPLKTIRRRRTSLDGLGLSTFICTAGTSGAAFSSTLAPPARRVLRSDGEPLSWAKLARCEQSRGFIAALTGAPLDGSRSSSPAQFCSYTKHNTVQHRRLVSVVEWRSGF